MWPLAKEKKAGGSAKGPEQDACGPVLMEIEDLRSKKDSGDEGGCADRVEGDGKSRKAFSENRSAEMKSSHHDEDKSEAECGGETLPMGGDKKCDASGEEDSSEEERHEDRPTQRGTLFMGRFEGEDAACSRRVDDPGGEPSLYAGGELCAVGHAEGAKGEDIAR